MRKQGYFTKTRSGRSASILLSGLLLCLLTLSNTYTYAVNDQQTITLNVQNASLEKVFKEIEKQTHFSFLYMQAVLKNAKHVNVKVSNASIEKVLELCFRDQPGLTYSIMDRVVVVKVKAVVSEGQGKQEVGDPIDVSGRVMDEEGKPLVGANVKVRGGNSGVVTDEEGRFMLRDVSENSVLEISYVGHEMQIVSVRGQRMLVINLRQTNSILDEAVVLAYGTTTKRLNTGNVATIKASEIEKQPINNPLLALQGRVPGLYIAQANGLPGSGVKVTIQGLNSLTKSSDPLYVIDGVPYISQLLPNIGAILGTSGSNPTSGFNSNNGNPLSLINPSDIERIEILKDADATAIYGSRAANGAILITTKKGRSGKNKVDINVQTGWGKVVNKLNLLNTQQYLEMRLEAKKNDNLPISSTDYDINGLWDSTRYTDWQKELIGGTAKITNVNANISGGNDNIQYLVGGTYYRESTVFLGDFADQKASVHFNINASSSNKRFRIQLSGNYLADNNQLLQTDLTIPALALPPNAPALYNEDGTINWMLNAAGASTWYNPLGYLFNTYSIKSNNLISNAILSYQILPGLEIKSSVGYTNLQSNEIRSNPLVGMRPERRPTALRNAEYRNNSLHTMIVEPQLAYKKMIRNSTLEAIFGGTYQQNNSDILGLIGSGYNTDQALHNVVSAATIISSDATSASIYKYAAVFGRINYNWQDRYIVNLSARRDGSSRFGSESQFHNFGALGIGWIFSNESLISKNIQFLSFGKFRGSYGNTGNDQIGDYQFLNLYNSNGPLLGNVQLPYQGISVLAPKGLPNPYIEWEETKKLQLGLDLGILKDRILISATYFKNRSSNQLIGYSLPYLTGFSDITQNFPATVENSGWEISLSTINVKGDAFNWSSNINLTVPRNKLVEFPSLEYSSLSGNLVVGQPITIIKAFHFAGVDPSTGKYQFVDSHGALTSTPDFLTDKTVLINAQPTLFGGFQNSFRYKKFELNILFQFVRQKASNYRFGRFIPGNNSNQPVSVLDRWQKIGDETSIQRYNSNSSLSTQYFSATTTDAFFTDASFVRLKNLSLSWGFPDAWKSKIRLQNCSLFMQGQNLVTITNYDGLDPETGSSNALPPLRIVTLGVQIGL